MHQSSKPGFPGLLTTFVVLLALMALPALADGDHNSKIEFENGADWGPARVDVYNGDDSDCIAPHKDYDVGIDGTRTVKCHGKGKHRCFIAVRRKLAEKWKTHVECKKVKDGASCLFEKNTDTDNHHLVCTSDE